MPNKKSSPIATPETVTLDAYEQSIEDALDATKMTSQLTPAMRRQIQRAARPMNPIPPLQP